MSYKPARTLVVRPAPRRARTHLRGFGAAEEVIEETVTETVGSTTNSGLRTAVGVGSLALIGVGLWFGLTKKTSSGARRYRWAV
jgi:hypothetical protein